MPDKNIPAEKIWSNLVEKYGDDLEVLKALIDGNRENPGLKWKFLGRQNLLIIKLLFEILRNQNAKEARDMLR